MAIDSKLCIIERALIDGFDVSNSKVLDEICQKIHLNNLNEKSIAAIYGICINEEKYTFEQIDVILAGIKSNLDISIINYPELYNSRQMFQILLGIRDNLDISQYAMPELSNADMSDIRGSLLLKKHGKI